MGEGGRDVDAWERVEQDELLSEMFERVRPVAVDTSHFVSPR